MRLADVLDSLAQELAGEGVPPARADARDLIAAVLGQPRFWPSAHPSVELDDLAMGAIRVAADRLGRGMPFQYAVGRAAFRHLALRVDQRVLIPRPETELLVDLALALAASGGVVADVGTGSGAIALSLASEGPFKRVIATDISEDALALARANLDAIPPDRRPLLEFRAGDLLGPLRGERLCAIVSNPPYISHAEASDLPAGVRDWEPHLALFSDDDGMAATHAILRDAPSVLEGGGVLVLEVDSGRAAIAREHAATDARWRDVGLRTDLTGRERFLVARRQEW
ncbi:MAG TPA: peptide chain release factor N(5)-glutamine methyltransferase [Gemmatimonadaceae bacterium]|nr:peptide chain release factor N(5)-glutamine methyltransferase [Gemmatimonadaceae bacterium]